MGYYNKGNERRHINERRHVILDAIDTIYSNNNGINVKGLVMATLEPFITAIYIDVDNIAIILSNYNSYDY